MAGPGVAKAQALSVTQRITITAVVAPATYVVVNEKDQIIQIASNTDQDVAPRVYLQKVAAGNERDLTTQIYASFRDKVPSGGNKVGILYELDTRDALTVRSLITINRIPVTTDRS